MKPPHSHHCNDLRFLDCTSHRRGGALSFSVAPRAGWARTTPGWWQLRTRSMVMSSELIEWRSSDWERVTCAFADRLANRVRFGSAPRERQTAPLEPRALPLSYGGRWKIQAKPVVKLPHQKGRLSDLRPTGCDPRASGRCRPDRWLQRAANPDLPTARCRTTRASRLSPGSSDDPC